MKNNFFIAWIIVCFFSACKKNEIPVYNGLENIYFMKALVPEYSSGPLIDSFNISFAFGNPSQTDSIVKIPVRIMGYPTNSDRPYAVRVNETSSAIEGQHYEALPNQFLLGAGRVQDSVAIKFLRTPDMLADTLVLEIELVSNEYFNTEMKYLITNSLSGAKRNYTKFKVYVTDVLPKPEFWFDPYLGVFSKEKLFLMSDVLDLPLSSFSQPRTAFPISLLQFYGKFMQRYLNDMKGAGTPVLEADGSEMIMGPSVQ